MAKIKLKSKLNKSANSNWEIVDDLSKAQNGLNTLPIDNTRVDKIYIDKSKSKKTYQSPFSKDKQEWINKSTGRIEESMSPLDLIPIGAVNTSSKFINNAFKFYSNYNKAADVVNGYELYNDLDKLPSSRQQFITTVKKNGGKVSQWEVMEEGGDVTQKGYKRNSPYVNNKQNIINSGRITMKGVDFPVHGVDEYGNEQMMFPNGEYSFPGNQVTETRMKKNGGCLECEQKSLIKAQGGITVDDNIQKFNELQRQISDIRNIRLKAVDKAKEVVKSGKYYELPKSALNFEQTQGKQEETCINGVCGVYNDVGVKFDQPGTVEGRFIGNGTFRNINPKTGNPNYYDAGFRPIYNRDEMQVGDLVAWGKGHMQIMTDKDADGFKSFDNYNKAERAYKWGELSNPVVYGEKKTYREPLGFRYSKNENELQQQRDSLKKEIQKDNPHFLDNTFVPKYGDYKQLNTVNYTPTEGNTLSIKKANAEKWLSSILPDQKKYMQDYNLSQSEFEKIAKLYSGILEQESDLGTSPRYFAKKIPLMQLFGKELTDLKDIYKGKKPTYSLSDMIFNENYSQGVGQIKPKWFKEDNKYGIDVDDPRAAFITLLDRYKNQVHENKGTEEGYRQLVNAYKGIKSPNNEYLKNVFDYANKVNFNSDLVAPKFDYEGSKKKNQMPIRRGQYVESPTMKTGGEISKWEIINYYIYKIMKIRNKETGGI